MKARGRFIILVVATLAAALAHAAEPARLDAARFGADLKALTATPHRLAGTPEGVRAGDYIASELKKLKGQVLSQHFWFPRQTLERCELRTAAGVIPLQPLLANGLQASVTSRDGFEGRIVHIGTGTDAELAGKVLKDSLVVADFCAERAVVEVFRRKAKAIIFVGAPTDDRTVLADKRTYVSVDLPRFYVPADVAARGGLSKASSGTLVCRVRWTKREGRNVYLWIAGKKPLFKLETKSEEFAILSAAYDSDGIVPYLCPSREAAANCAALLETARVLAANPPRRNVLIAFFDNHANYLEGGRQFYTAYRRSIPGTAKTKEKPDRNILNERQQFVADERDYLKGLLAYLAEPDLFASTNDLKPAGLTRLRDEAKYQYNHDQEQLTDLRFQQDDAERKGQPTDSLKSRIEELVATQKKWQWVRESIRDERKPRDEAQPIFEECVLNVVDRCKNRLEELQEVEKYLSDCLAFTAPLAGGTPVAHVSYRFTAGNDRWLFLPLGTTHDKLYATLLDRVSAAVPADRRERVGFVWESRNVLQSKVFSPTSYISYPAEEESLFAEFFEIPALTLVTAQDKQPWLGMPNDSVSDADLDRIRAQAEGFLVFLTPMLNADWASVPNRVLKNKPAYIDDYEWKRDEAVGHQVKSFTFGDTAASRIEPDVLVHVMRRWAEPVDYYVWADGNGCFPLLSISPNWRYVFLESAKFDASGHISALTTCVPTGGLGSVSTGWAKAGFYAMESYRKFYAILNMFEGEGGRIAGRNLPFGEPFQEANFTLLNGLSNSVYKRSHFRYDPTVGVGVYYVGNPLGVKLIYEDSRNADNVALYLNITKKEPLGVGYGPGSPEPKGNVPYTLDLETATAGDMFKLNEQRLNTLRQKNIILNFLEYMHSQAEHLLDEFKKAVAAEQHGVASVLAVRAAALERHIYRPVRATINDMVKAVTILLLLAIPFSFSLQSLVLPTYNIYRRILYFALLFLLSFVVLYFVHPAFSFATFPVIIILAFIIVVMSGGVIWIISDKFVYEIKKMQGLAKAAHSFEQNVFGNIGAAVSLAISTMRRRPIRTALTVVTVLLLTFTILSFVSFQAEKGVNKFYVGTGDQESRLLLRRRVWKSMDPNVMREITEYLGKGYIIHGRYWKARELTTTMVMEDLYIPIRRRGGGSAVAGVIMTMDAYELTHIPGLRKCLPGDLARFNEGKGVYLPASIASELKAKPGDMLRIQGEDLEFLGAFNSQELLKQHQLDGSPLLPVNFSLTKLAIGEFESKGSAGGSTNALVDLEAELSQLEPDALEPVTPDGVIIVSSKAHRRLGMSLKGILIYPEEGLDLEKLSDRLALLFDDGVYLNQGGERSFFFYGEKYGVTGAGDVAIPLILGGLIVFSTMLGSIIDREREIYTFSALGLGPKNIAMLFFVEAGIYAVIGGFGGYMFSQVVTRILEWLASYGIFKAPEMNYSSSTAIYTILLVMVTVVVSTIYPAVKAAKKATADTTSRWRVPPPEGDVCSFGFPFTISQYDITGIICFLREHFASHADRTIGKFAADNVELFREEKYGMAGLRACVWLQPFDQGISQEFELTARPSDIEEVCEVHVTSRRLSGPPSAWKRSNTIYLKDLRLQFLLWRTLDDAARDHYLGIGEVEESVLGITANEGVAVP